MKRSGMVCVFVALLACACTALPDVPLPADAGNDSPADAGPDAPRLPSRFVASSGQVEGRSEHYRVQLSAGMPQPIGIAESKSFRVLVGPRAPYEKGE